MDTGGTEAKLRDYLKRVTAELSQTRHRLKQVEDEAAEPIAIIGMACRLPGGIDSPQALWRLLDAGEQVLEPFPTDRGWDLSDPDPGYVRRAALLSDAADFDNAFFGIAPREALAMDPQQRLLLETSWEAIEDAGVDARLLRGRQVGVFTGIFDNGYLSDLGEVPEATKGYGITGSLTSVASGRVAYHLGLHGPAISIDTACSSSMTALHLAIRSLRGAECDLALVGGATILPSTFMWDDFSRQGGLAADARIKPFSAAADGTNWSEGAAVLMVERLSDARRNGHRVLALLRGSALNQDGASNGLTAPNDLAQERLITAALADARLSPADVDVVEAHGTGTPLGDAIEAKALLATYGRDRPRDRPLWLGSVKSNLGHSGACAGMTSVIKTVQSMRHATMPRTLNIDTLSTNVDWEGGGVAVLTEAREWTTPPGRPRRAGVSGFGVSGTNAHVIIEAAPEIDAVTPSPRTPPPVALWTLSGRDEAALRAQAERLLSHAEAAELSLRDVEYTLATARVAFAERAVIAATDLAGQLAGLRALADGVEAPNLLRDNASGGKTAFLFTGQGSQRPGMGRELYEEYPAFAAAFDEVCAHMDPHLKRPLRELVFGDDPEAINATAHTQPALFAIEVALFRLFESWGVTPDYLSGHSIGELSAAHAAGVLSLADACTLVAARGRLMQDLPAGGAMVAVRATEAEVRPLLNPLVDIATVNGPESVVIAGDAEAVAEVAAEFASRGRKTKRLTVSHAFHSPLMEPMLAEFGEIARDLTYHPPRIPIVSNLTAEVVGSQLSDPEFWVRHVREAVRFADGARALLDAGVTTFVELGPDSTLCAAVADTADDPRVRRIPVLRPGRPETAALAEALGRVHARGVDIDWNRYFAGTGARTVSLPTYPFQRRRFWAEPTAARSDVTAAGVDAVEHGLLGGALRLADTDAWLFTGRVSAATHPWLADHVVAGDILLPGTAFVDMAWHVAATTGCPRVAELTVQAPLVVPADGAARIQVTVEAPDWAGHRAVTVFARPEADPEAQWTRHATGALAPAATTPAAALTQWPPARAEAVDVGGFYPDLDERGYRYGPAFRRVTAAWREGDRLYYEVDAAEAQSAEAGRYGVHPALLDAAVHGGMLAMDLDGRQGLPVAFAWSGLELHEPGATALRVCADMTEAGPTAVTLYDRDGRVVATVDALELRELTGGGAAEAAEAELITLHWVERDLPDGGEVSWRFLPDGDDGLSRLPEPAPAVVVVPPQDDGLDVTAVVARAMDLVRAWLSQDRFVRSTLVFMYRDDPAQSAIAGLLRSAHTEQPGRFGLIHTQSGPLDGLDAAVRAVVAGESEVRLGAGTITVPRLTRRGRPSVLTPPAGEDWRLAATEANTVAVVPATAATDPLEPGQVRVRVKAAGLNFRDLAISLDLVSDADAYVGLEGAGIVTELGAEVDRFAVGDRVMGVLPRGMGPVAIGRAEDLVRLPDDWTFAQGAAIPVAFLTCWLSLVDVAAVQPGERVLVHSATGGVGLAAVQIARHLGAEVFATASPPKQHLLRDLGLDDAHIASTRTLDFREHFLAATGGAGMDVVLNTLAGEFTDASLDLLPNGGRFVELGKTDVRDAEAVAAAHPGVRYEYFHLEPADFGAEIPTAWDRMLPLFDTGELRVPLLRTWPITRAPEAFEQMRRARHLGKIVFTMPPAWDPDKTVLITGGTGTLGALTARHLVTRHGVRHLVLTSRRGPAAAGAKELTVELEALGAQVTVTACDSGDREAVRRLLADIPGRHPLGGIVHCAGVLANALVSDLTDAEVTRVLHAKAESAVHLDELTAELPLDHFILFSSGAGVLGWPAQSNYSAANSHLDGLARRRRASGRAAVSMDWGMWAEISEMTRTVGQYDLARLGRFGVRPMPTREALALFDAAVAVDEPEVLVYGVDRAGLRRQLTAGNVPAILSELIAAPRPTPETDRAAADQPLDRRLAGLSDADRFGMLLDLVRSQAATVLLLNRPTDIGVEQSFRDVGVDSLTAVELRNRLNKLTGLHLPVSAVLDHPSPRRLAEVIDAELSAAAPAAETVAVASAAPVRSADSLAGLLKGATGSVRLPQRHRIALGLAELREQFEDAADYPPTAGFTLLRDGEADKPFVICVPPFIGQPNPFHYNKFAANLPAGWSAIVLALPGYRNGEPLPATIEALTGALAATVREQAKGRSFILMGHSSGGLMAGAVAEHLEREGLPPHRLVLLDTPRLRAGVMPEWFPTLYDHLTKATEMIGLGDDEDAWLTAEARYNTFDYTVSRPRTPTLVMHAGEPLAGISFEENRWEIVWDAPHDLVRGPGSHITLLQGDNAVESTRVIVDWIAAPVRRDA